jgi:hypothetical protein
MRIGALVSASGRALPFVLAAEPRSGQTPRGIKPVEEAREILGRDAGQGELTPIRGIAPGPPGMVEGLPLACKTQPVPGWCRSETAKAPLNLGCSRMRLAGACGDKELR